MNAWTSELAGADAQPLVAAAAEAATVAWLARRYAEGDLHAAPAARRAAALTRLTAANRQLLEAVKLVATARTASVTRPEHATPRGE